MVRYIIKHSKDRWGDNKILVAKNITEARKKFKNSPVGKKLKIKKIKRLPKRYQD